MLKILWAFAFLTNLTGLGKCATKSWRFSNDVWNPLNWVDGKPGKNCVGIHFPENLDTVASVYQLFTAEVTLPNDGEIEIQDGGFIHISKNYNTCLKIKKSKHRFWLDPENWNVTNRAVPDVERVPCLHDDVIFPANSTVSVFYPEVDVSVASISFGGANMSDERWQSFLQSDYGTEQFNILPYGSAIAVSHNPCAHYHGCLCFLSEDFYHGVCRHALVKQPFCLRPVKPHGHCGQICGGLLYLELNPFVAFRLDEFIASIPRDERVDSYASRIYVEGKFYIQVVFVEKEDYTELSSSMASAFHKEIARDLSKWKFEAALLDVSGVAIPQGSHSAVAFSIIMGTFMAVALLFGVIYVFYVGPLENHRIPFGEISFGNLRPFLFAKLDNDRGRMSMAASVMSLEKSFDNPLYESRKVSTSSVVEAVMLNEAGTSSAETTMPLETAVEVKEEKLVEVEIEDVHV